MLKKIFEKIFLIPLKRKKLKKINTFISLNASIDLYTKFEGENYLGSKVKVRSSKIGYGSYIATNSIIVKTIIGRYTSIGPNVNIILGQHPTSTFVSTHPAFYSKNTKNLSYVTSQLYNEFRYADKNSTYSAVIGNDVWIGENAKIMEGITIGDGAIVAAGSIITKNVPNYAIVGGVPAKIIRYRFSKENIKFMNELKWWDRSEEWIIKNINLFNDIDVMYEKYR